jgi:hypothetical protein
VQFDFGCGHGRLPFGRAMQEREIRHDERSPEQVSTSVPQAIERAYENRLMLETCVAPSLAASS